MDPEEGASLIGLMARRAPEDAPGLAGGALAPSEILSGDWLEGGAGSLKVARGLETLLREKCWWSLWALFLADPLLPPSLVTEEGSTAAAAPLAR